MTYPHLENAPEDHHSEEFLTYLREHNVVVAENRQWLVIQNCKYHSAERPWLTAFLKFNTKLPYTSDMKKLGQLFPQYDLLIKAPQRRTVERFHVHLILEK